MTDGAVCKLYTTSIVRCPCKTERVESASRKDRRDSSLSNLHINYSELKSLELLRRVQEIKHAPFVFFVDFRWRIVK